MCLLKFECFENLNAIKLLWCLMLLAVTKKGTLVHFKTSNRRCEKTLKDIDLSLSPQKLAQKSV